MKTFDYALLESMYASVCKERDTLRAELVRTNSYNEMQKMLLDNMQAELDALREQEPAILPDEAYELGLDAIPYYAAPKPEDKATAAWADVQDATQWLEDLRGNTGEPE